MGHLTANNGSFPHFYLGTRDQTDEGLCWLGRSPFFVMFNRMFNKWGQNAVTPIYTHIPQYPEITGYFFIPSYNRMVPLLTIFYKKGIRP